ncbi:MAG: FAD-dependent oxidoreductase, partial [Chitinophagaceae bacterium]|nr:FAD-dependent oxidoreductase [Anaerolineae bacterium]
CMAMGQAAGIAAVIASSEHVSPREVNLSALQDQLRLVGAVI